MVSVHHYHSCLYLFYFSTLNHILWWRQQEDDGIQVLASCYHYALHSIVYTSSSNILSLPLRRCCPVIWSRNQHEINNTCTLHGRLPCIDVNTLCSMVHHYHSLLQHFRTLNIDTSLYASILFRYLITSDCQCSSHHPVMAAANPNQQQMILKLKKRHATKKAAISRRINGIRELINERGVEEPRSKNCWNSC